jgi:formiminotetrahydrofolate cyclodeaminase
VTTRVSDYTLEDFSREAASRHPTPAGVAVAAVAGSFALGLLAKVLIISRHRKALADHAGSLESLAAAAQAASSRMLQLADDDVAAFQAYLAATRLPSSTEQQREERQRAIGSARYRTIEVPLAAAQEAAAGLQLCSDASTLVPRELIADLDVTTALLEGARRGFLRCANSNVQQEEAPAAPRSGP